MTFSDSASPASASGSEPVSEPWLPSLARIAGSEDIPSFSEAVVGLFRSALPHDVLVLSCQFITSVFDQHGLSEDPALVCNSGLSAHAVFTSLGEVSVIAAEQAIFFPRQVGRHTWAYGMGVNLDYRGGFGATIMLYRTAEQGTFDAAAIATAHLLKPVCQQALIRLLDQQQTRALQKNLIGFLHDLPVGLIMLDWDRTPIFVNREGYRQTLLWNHAPDMPPRHLDPKQAFRLPEDIYAVSSDFLRRWQDAVLGGPAPSGERAPVVMLQNAARPEMRASVTASHLPEENSEPPKYLVRYYGMSTRAAPEFEPTPEQLQLLAQLTPTERAIALLVLQGLSNREIAGRLHREISTVKDHLTHIFDKLSIRSRVQLIRLLS